MESDEVDTLTAAQCKMARAGLGLSLTAAAMASKVSRASIVRFESGKDLRLVLRQALRAAFEKQGAVFAEGSVKVVASEVV